MCFSLTLCQSFIQLPDNFQDEYRRTFGEKARPEVLTHCKRDLFQAIWDFLLDEKFMEAYKNGLIVECGDGVRRRIFPRFFSYTADYPEK